MPSEIQSNLEKIAKSGKVRMKKEFRKGMHNLADCIMATGSFGTRSEFSQYLSERLKSDGTSISSNRIYSFLFYEGDLSNQLASRALELPWHYRLMNEMEAILKGSAKPEGQKHSYRGRKGLKKDRVDASLIRLKLEEILRTGKILPQYKVYERVAAETGYSADTIVNIVTGNKQKGPRVVLECMAELYKSLKEEPSLHEKMYSLADKLMSIGIFRDRASLAQYISERLKIEAQKNSKNRVFSFLFEKRDEPRRIRPWHYDAYEKMLEAGNRPEGVNALYSRLDFPNYKALLEFAYGSMLLKGIASKEEFNQFIGQRIGLSPCTISNQWTRSYNVKGTFSRSGSYAKKLLEFVMEELLIAVDLTDSSGSIEDELAHLAKGGSNGRNRVIALLNKDYTAEQCRRISNYVHGSSVGVEIKEHDASNLSFFLLTMETLQIARQRNYSVSYIFAPNHLYEVLKQLKSPKN